MQKDSGLCDFSLFEVFIRSLKYRWPVQIIPSPSQIPRIAPFPFLRTVILGLEIDMLSCYFIVKLKPEVVRLANLRRE